MAFNSVALEFSGSDSARDVFVTKLDSSGSGVWTRTAGAHIPSTNSNELVDGIGIDAAGNAYIVGTYVGGFTFPSSPSTTVGYGNVGDLYTAKFSSTGQAEWEQSISSNNPVFAEDIDVHAATGNASITGSFYSALTIPTSPATYISAGSYRQMFVVQYDNAGNARWVRQSNGNSLNRGTGIAVDNVGSVYVTGDFASSTIDFTGFGGSSPTLVRSGAQENFVVKYNQNGNGQWTEASIGQAGTNVFGEKITVTPAQVVYITGYFSKAGGSPGNVSLDSGANYLSSTADYVDGFIARVSNIGNYYKIATGGGIDVTASETAQYQANASAKFTGGGNIRKNQELLEKLANERMLSGEWRLMTGAPEVNNLKFFAFDLVGSTDSRSVSALLWMNGTKAKEEITTAAQHTIVSAVEATTGVLNVDTVTRSGDFVDAMRSG